MQWEQVNYSINSGYMMEQGGVSHKIFQIKNITIGHQQNLVIIDCGLM